jgi:hypothetical protein
MFEDSDSDDDFGSGFGGSKNKKNVRKYLK